MNQTHPAAPAPTRVRHCPDHLIVVRCGPRVNVVLRPACTVPVAMTPDDADAEIARLVRHACPLLIVEPMGKAGA